MTIDGSSEREFLADMGKNRPVKKPFKETLKPLRPLLPSPLPSPAPSSSAVQEPLTHQCNGVKPICYHCKVKGIDCIYRVSVKDTLKQHSDELCKVRVTSNIFHAIQTCSDHDASGIYHYIRAGMDPESVSRHIGTRDIKPVSQTKRRYILPHRTQMPTYLMTPDNNYLDALAQEWPQESSAQSGARPGLKEASADNSQRIQYLMPYGAADLVEPRLECCMPSRWTSVSSDDTLMREILKLYFLYEYPSAPFFHKDLFLDDMLAATGRFCTSLLVNAVLSQACHCYNRFTNRAEYWYPHTLGYKFSAEAKRLLELESLQDESITSIQAILILSCVLNFSGLDRIGLVYIRRALDMGRNLGLLDSPAEANDANVLRNRVFTAWCLFNWRSLTYYYMAIHPNADEVPQVDLHDPKEHVDWYGEINVKYPTSDALIPTRFGLAFKAQCELAVLMHRLTSCRYATQCDKSDGTLVHNTARVISDLHAWYAALPECLRPYNIVFPKDLKLHLQYFTIMIQLSNMPSHDTSPPSVTTSGVSLMATIQNKVAMYKLNFETIIWAYYLRHGFETPDMMLTLFLSFLAFDFVDKVKIYSETPQDLGIQGSHKVLPDPVMEEIRPTLILAQKGLIEQGQSYYLPQTVAHLVLADMDEETAEPILHPNGGSVEDADARQLRAQHIEACLPIKWRSFSETPNHERLNSLVRRYAAIMTG
ncbi:hypothetical protein S7711_06721 [Stachybotrys chartarum IBT 7711]|uniref:Xylanolytic transcriptional activator regulatory domain-containing protein n=1 Tax=Stachybotrys chartarum (strain CBS 109288 / IBT 7711) TaxID=1280523 RepID=A0A084B5R1_STACB|nr:hypothetical protein S7711_06721 [Stachybotrys chartarum IBT 7711]